MRSGSENEAQPGNLRGKYLTGKIIGNWNHLPKYMVDSRLDVPISCTLRMTGDDMCTLLCAGNQTNDEKGSL